MEAGSNRQRRARRRIRREEQGTGEAECSESLVWWERALRLERDFGGATFWADGRGGIIPFPRHPENQEPGRCSSTHSQSHRWTPGCRAPAHHGLFEGRQASSTTLELLSIILNFLLSKVLKECGVEGQESHGLRATREVKKKDFSVPRVNTNSKVTNFSSRFTIWQIVF